MQTDRHASPSHRELLAAATTAGLTVLVGIILVLARWGALLTTVGVGLMVLGVLAALIVLLQHRMPRS